MSFPETPYSATFPLLTGHFTVRRNYACWRSHGTDDWLLIHTLGGNGRFGYLGETTHRAGENGEFVGEIETTAGDTILLRPGALHDYGTAPESESWELVWAHFLPRASWLEWLQWPKIGDGLMRLELRKSSTRSRIAARLHDVHRLAIGALAQRENFAFNALEEVLLWCDEANPLAAQAQTDARVRAAMNYMSANLAQKISVGDVAKACGLSVSRLSHLFPQEIGGTPQAFLETQRLNRARQLLERTTLSISQIAEEVGFDNPFYFSLRFKKHSGQNPRDFRRTRISSTRYGANTSQL